MNLNLQSKAATVQVHYALFIQIINVKPLLHNPKDLFQIFLIIHDLESNLNQRFFIKICIQTDCEAEAIIINLFISFLAEKKCLVPNQDPELNNEKKSKLESTGCKKPTINIQLICLLFVAIKKKTLFRLVVLFCINRCIFKYLDKQSKQF